MLSPENHHDSSLRFDASAAGFDSARRKPPRCYTMTSVPVGVGPAVAIAPSASYSITLRVEIKNRPGMLGRVASAIGNAGGDIGSVDLVESLRDRIVRDITVKARDSVHGQQIVTCLRHVAGVRVVHVSDRTFLMHLGGKIEIKNKVPVRTRDDLSMVYTPGVARVCLAIRDDRERAFALTMKHNSVAVVTDGTAVLGLGDIGPEAALPVM